MQGVGPGSVLGGRYAVTLRTSEGTHHERWRANDHTLEREVVLVCFPARSSVAAPALDAARRAAGIEDSRLVRVLDVGSDQGVGFIVEEPLTGAVPLSHLLQGGGLSPDEVRRLTGEAATALDKAGHRGLHHLALSPSSVLRMPDGEVKVRGLATEAALTDADRLSDEQASRADAVGLVKIAYAGLTGRWPMVAVDGGLVPAGAPVGLEPAPTIVGGVAAPSEIAVGVPNDLDLICRMTLSGARRGPVSPGDLALQIAPWPSEPPASDGATGIGLRSREELEPTRVLPAVGASAAAGAPGASLHADAADGLQGDPPGQSETSFFDSLSEARSGQSVGPGDEPSRGAGDASERIPGALAAAGAAAAGVAGSIGDKVGSFARAAADKAAARAAERRSAHDDDFDGEEIALADALEEAPTTSLEPPLPVFGREVPEAPSGAQSRIALAIVGVLVLVALVIGINNVAKIGQHDGPAVAVTVTKTRPPSTSQQQQQPSTSTQAPSPTTQTPAGPVEITGGKGFDPQDGNEADQNVKNVYDGSDDDGWRSRWYGTPSYNGDKDGVGVLLELSAPTAVKEVELDLPAAQNVTVYATNSDSTDSLDGAQKVGSMKNAEGRVTIKADGTLEPASRIIVFITKAGQAESDGRYRAQINEVTVR
ncbi:protein kinase family protein [Terrabacter sp. MAHUQ-38]|uniref:protein kinase family protein n=1 Tax=unclassified Terrabacter TaxID=2630222 RepID=UPI00165E6397|nr:protein kinase family protein [Terrabacter sp. MAHUQ-38]MBC9820315.1 protein kinase family protein [Terrabacter sp. MAHUQ-38]